MNFHDLFKKIQELSPKKMYFSAGVGDSLRNAYIALLNSKSNGKNSITIFNNIR
jgi:GGDEF domain-containing protein